MVFYSLCDKHCTDNKHLILLFLYFSCRKIIGFGKAEAQVCILLCVLVTSLYVVVTCACPSCAQVKNSEKLKGLTAQVQRSWDGLKNSNFRNYLERLQEGLVNPSDSEALKYIHVHVYVHVMPSKSWGLIHVTCTSGLIGCQDIILVTIE